jgi:beta-galactosidase
MSMNAKSKWPVTGFARGADWNPDQWPREVWLRDLELMVEAKVNLVTFPVFGWAWLEKSDGVFDFHLLDELMDQLANFGIGADLATATATPPAWLVRQHPEVLPVDINGVHLEYGSRQSYCPNSKTFRSGLVRLVTKIAERYHEHPALKMWHVSNEYGDHISRCYCQNCEVAFRNWLISKYKNIGNLNKAWGTSMWGQLYSDFAEIKPPRKTMAPSNPSHTLDYARFSSDSISELLALEKDTLDSLSPGIPVLTNLMTVQTDVDYWKLSRHLDIVAFDNYPDPADLLAHNAAALNYSLMRSLANREPWMLLESATSAVSWRSHNVPKPDGINRLHVFQAVAHGSDAVMYFQWRASTVGAERFHSAVIGHFGEASRTHLETKKIWHELESLEKVAGSRVRASVAILIDWESRWAMNGPETMPSEKLVWIQQVRDYHRVLMSLGVTTNVVHPEADLSEYDLIVGPSAFMLSTQAIENLSSYVSTGGHLLLGPFSAVVDENNHVANTGYLGGLGQVLGIRVEEYWPVATPAEVALSSGARVWTQNWTELIHPDESTSILGTYSSGPLSGKAAVTSHKFGQGLASYISCDLESNALSEVMRTILTSAGLSQRNQSNEEVECVVRTDGVTDFCFVLNHGSKEAKVSLPPSSEILIGDVNLVENGSFHLEPQNVLIYQIPSNSPSLVLAEMIQVGQ